MEFTFSKEQNTLKVFLKGRLDATTAPGFEAEVIPQVEGVEEIIIDADALEYISSAGLRVILKLKHLVSETSVINTSAEVYDIFEMTGFSEMMKVVKKFRELSVDGCEVIGKGFYGTVYRISKDTIVKVYSKLMPFEGIEKERELARKAFVMGVPTAIPYDIVKVADQYGSVFELLDAETLQKRIIKDMKNLDKYLSDYIKVLKIIHSNEVKPGELVDKKQEVLGWATKVAQVIDKKSAAKLFTLLKGIKEDNHMLHGDYHIKNIMIQNNEPFIIDMDTLAMGSPIFEFGFMYSCYSAYQEIDRSNGMAFFGIEQDILDDMFKKAIAMYFDEKSENYIKDIVKKARIISYTQLIPRFIQFNDHPQELELFKKEIVELLDEVEDLNI